MNPCKPPRAIVKLGLILLSLAGFLGTTSPAAPVTLPDWVKPIESSLPKLPPAVISEVDEIRAFRVNENSSDHPEQAAKWLSHQRRIVELQEQAGQAMLWQYLKASGGKYGDDKILKSLRGDRDLAAWLLPVVRFRIEWLKQALHDPGQKQHIQKVLESFEIYDILDYLYGQGEFTDIENLNLFMDEANKSKVHLSFILRDGYVMRDGLSIAQRLSDMVKGMQEERKRSWQTEPYWQVAARHLIQIGVLKADALKPRAPVQNQGDGGNRPKPLGPRKPLPGNKTWQPWMMRPMWLFIAAVSAGLLLWLFRKHKRVSPSGEFQIAK